MSQISTIKFQPERISYGFIALALVLVGWLNLTALILTGLFGYFALEKLAIRGKVSSLRPSRFRGASASRPAGRSGLARI